MKVHELIAKLQKQPRDLEVMFRLQDDMYHIDLIGQTYVRETEVGHGIRRTVAQTTDHFLNDSKPLSCVVQIL